MIRNTSLALALALITVGAAALPAQEVTLADLLAQADRASPRIAAARQAAQAAAARVPQAGTLPDPMLGLGLMNVPVRDPSLSGDMMTMAQLQVGMQLPWPGKLGFREAVARRQAEAAEWEAEGVRQKVRADVKAAYYQLYFIDRALEVAGRNERLVEDFALITSARYGVGTGAQPDVLKAQVERTRLQDQLVALRERRTSGVARLNALLGRSTDTSLPATELPEEVRVAALAGKGNGPTFASAALAGVLPGADGEGVPPATADLQALAREHNPMIQAHLRCVAGQEEALALAGVAKRPDLNVTASYGRRAALGDFFNVMVSAPVPIFSGRKQDRAVVEEAATLSEHRARHRVMVDELNAEVASLSAALQRKRDQLVLLNDGILPQAGTALSSATASYQVGRVDFLTLLDAQVTLYDQELQYHRLLADFGTNLAALERAVGREVLP